VEDNNPHTTDDKPTWGARTNKFGKEIHVRSDVDAEYLGQDGLRR
jgi:hypothetical protein